MKRNRTGRASRGFTLVEMLVVLGILVVLVSLVAPRIIGSQKKADIKAARTQIGLFKNALQKYAIDVKSFPATEQGLQALIERPVDIDENVDGEWPYLDGSIPKDPWGNEYMYEYPGTHGTVDAPEIWSFGPDKEENTADDICSWERTSEEGMEPAAETKTTDRTPRSPRSPKGETTSTPTKTRVAPPPETKPVRSPRVKDAEGF